MSHAEMCKLFLPLPAKIDFQIQPSADSEGHNVYSVDSKGKFGLYKAILEAIRARIKVLNLDEILVRLNPNSSSHNMLNRFPRTCWLRTQTSSQDPA